MLSSWAILDNLEYAFHTMLRLIRRYLIPWQLQDHEILKRIGRAYKFTSSPEAQAFMDVQNDGRSLMFRFFSHMGNTRVV